MNEIINHAKSNKNIQAVIKFGTEGEQNNLLILTKQLHFSDLEKLKPALKKHIKRSKLAPVLFTESGLKDSADVFPLEILDMKYPHKVLYGQDILEKIKIHKKHVRAQVELELRSKLIHLREHFIGISKQRDLHALLQAAIPSLMPLFYGLLFLKNTKPPTDLEGLFTAVHVKYDVDMTLFKTIRAKAGKDADKQIHDLIILLETLINLVDKLKV